MFGDEMAFWRQSNALHIHWCTQLRIIIIVYHHFGWRILKRKGNENLDHAHVGGKKGRQKEADNDSRVSYCSMSTRWFSTELYVIASKHDSDLRYHTKWKNFGCNSSFSQLWNYTFALAHSRFHVHAAIQFYDILPQNENETFYDIILLANWALDVVCELERTRVCAKDGIIVHIHYTYQFCS